MRVSRATWNGTVGPVWVASKIAGTKDNPTIWWLTGEPLTFNGLDYMPFNNNLGRAMFWRIQSSTVTTGCPYLQHFVVDLAAAQSEATFIQNFYGQFLNLNFQESGIMRLHMVISSTKEKLGWIGSTFNRILNYSFDPDWKCLDGNTYTTNQVNATAT